VLEERPQTDFANVPSDSGVPFGKMTALVVVPNQRLFKMSAAAKYLGIHEQTLRKITDEGALRARLMRGCRVYTLEDLDAYIAIVGSVRVKDFSRSHAHYFIKQRSKTVKGATVNRGLAVIKNMLTFAIEKEIIDVHPLARFHMLPEEEVALRIPTLEEERRLVAAVMKENPTIGAYVGILGETGARMQEGLRLQWAFGQSESTAAHNRGNKKREGAAHTSFRLCDRVATDADSDRGMSVCLRLPRYDGSLP